MRFGSAWTPGLLRGGTDAIAVITSLRHTPDHPEGIVPLDVCCDPVRMLHLVYVLAAFADLGLSDTARLSGHDPELLLQDLGVGFAESALQP